MYLLKKSWDNFNATIKWAEEIELARKLTILIILGTLLFLFWEILWRVTAFIVLVVSSLAIIFIAITALIEGVKWSVSKWKGK